MTKALLLAIGCTALLPFSGVSARAQSGQGLAVDVANMREDVRLLNQRVGELLLRVEQLERENGDLRSKNASATQSCATVAQLNEMVADLNRTVKMATANAKAETLQQVSAQMERLAQRTNAALDSLAKGVGGRAPAAPPTFSEDYPKEGLPHVIAKGESLASIAKRYGAKQQDIINANKISDPSKIQVGQTLFIPGGK